MAKEILLYGHIWEGNALFFFNQVNEATEEDQEAQMNLRINCIGGEPQYAMSVIEKVQEMRSQFICKVGAAAHSMALFILAYLETENVECIDTTQAVLHRAAWPSWLEQSESYAGSMYEQLLAKTNKDLEKAFRAKVNVEALEALPQFTEKSLSLKDIFSMEARHEVLLTANDLKKIGLVSKINKITPTKKAEMAAQFEAFQNAKTFNDLKIAAQSTGQPETKKIDQPKNTNMTLEELKAAHPEVYAQVRKEAHEAGVKAERDRVEAIMVFNDVDPEGCKTAVESGNSLSAKQMAEFARKSMGADSLKKLAADSPAEVKTEGVVEPKTEKEKTLEAFSGKLEEKLGIKKQA